MPAITYVGPFDAVEVDGLGVVKNGDSIDAPDALAKSLLEQADNWSAPSKKSTHNDKQES